MSHMEAVVYEQKFCDICAMCGKQKKALYDAKCDNGGWGFLCQKHFEFYGCSLGLGKGQKLVVKDDK